MQRYRKVDLSQITFFRTHGGYPDFIVIEEEKDLYKLPPRFILIGDTSNLLIVGKLNVPVIRLALPPQIVKVQEDKNHVYIKASASILWDYFVYWCINHGYYGIENLSFIPGTVGGAVVQNIGAYGVEIKDYVVRVRVFDTKTQEIYTLENHECGFKYRDSLFKKQPGRLIVLEATFKLNRTFTPILTYKDLKDLLIKDAQKMREAIYKIRHKKLPDPTKEPNAGSFFKNPMIPLLHWQTLKEKYPHIFETAPHVIQGNTVKIPAAYLIERAGLKGYKMGKAAVSKKHALVLVNRGDPTGEDVWRLAEFIRTHIYEKYSIILEPEVLIVNARSLEEE